MKNTNLLKTFLTLLAQWNFNLSSFTLTHSSNPLLVEARIHIDENERPDPYNSSPLASNLQNGDSIPYIGLGLGNLQHELIPDMIQAAFSRTAPHPSEEGIEVDNNLGYRLIDTSRASNNEKLIATELAKVMKKNYESYPESTTIHIVTKVWYTHLGYERTKLSIQESMNNILNAFKDMSYVEVKMHLLIHWPRCYDGIEWMDCKGEEEMLPPSVKELDAPPHTNTLAFLHSWKAMEDMYKLHYPKIASIGISNFETEDLNTLLQSARIKPLVYQGNLEMIMEVMPILKENNIHIQMYGLLNALTSKRAVPKIDVARRYLMSLAEDLDTLEEEEEFKTHPSSLILSFLVENSIGVMVRTSSKENLIHNSPRKVSAVPELTSTQHDQLAHVLDSIQYHWNGEEDGNEYVKSGEKVHVTFQNRRNNEQQNPLTVLFVGNREEKVDDPQVVVSNLESMKSVSLESHPGHVFVVRDSVTGEDVTEFEVTKEYGRAQWFSVEL